MYVLWEDAGGMRRQGLSLRVVTKHKSSQRGQAQRQRDQGCEQVPGEGRNVRADARVPVQPDQLSQRPAPLHAAESIWATWVSRHQLVWVIQRADHSKCVMTAHPSGAEHPLVLESNF